MLTKLKRWTYINPVEDNVTEKSSGKGDSPLKPPWRGLRLYKLQPKRFMQACVYYKDTKHRSIDVLRSLEWMRSVKYFMRKDCALITPEQDIAQMGVGANKVSSMQSKTSHVKKKTDTLHKNANGSCDMSSCYLSKNLIPSIVEQRSGQFLCICPVFRPNVDW